MPKKLAVVTPWPPQKSGIADYAYDLIGAMRGPSLELHVFTNESAPFPLEGVIFHQVDDGNFGSVDLCSFDGVLFQLGNHPHFHGHMPELIQRYGGTVELHDVMLHHLVMGVHGLTNGDHHYFSWLANAYGAALADRIQRDLSSRNFLESELVQRYPCSDVITRSASTVIVHSYHAASRLVHAGRSPTSVPVVPLTHHKAHVQPKPRGAGGPLNLGVFGGVQANRRVEVIIRVIAHLGARGQDCRLQIVGDVDPDMAYLYELVKELALENRVTFHGRLPNVAMNDILASCDLVLALRDPTMGETSAVVIRALQFGVPCIVSDVGWYSELPECVRKINNAVLEQGLREELASLIAAPARLQGLREQTIAYANSELDLRITADDILLLTIGA